jgi:hypothetical protein
VVCSCCGRIFDADYSVAPELIRGLDHAVEQCTGVRVEGRSLFFSGVCPTCQAERPGHASLEHASPGHTVMTGGVNGARPFS